MGRTCTLTTDSKEALGAWHALRILSSKLPTARRHLSSASINTLRLYSCIAWVIRTGYGTHFEEITCTQVEILTKYLGTRLNVLPPLQYVKQDKRENFQRNTKKNSLNKQPLVRLQSYQNPGKGIFHTKETTPKKIRTYLKVFLDSCMKLSFVLLPCCSSTHSLSVEDVQCCLKSFFLSLLH